MDKQTCVLEISCEIHVDYWDFLFQIIGLEKSKVPQRTPITPFPSACVSEMTTDADFRDRKKKDKRGHGKNRTLKNITTTYL